MGVEVVGFFSNIWVLQKQRIQVEVVFNHTQYIHMKVCFVDAVDLFFFTVVNGSP